MFSRPCTVNLCGTADDRIITFAVNTFRPNSQYASRVIEYDVDVTLEGSKTPDFTVFTADLGLLLAGARNGQLVAVTVNNRDPKDETYPRIDFNATAPTDGSTVLLRVLASSIGLTSGAPRFTYQGSSFFRPDDQVNSTTLITDTTGKARFIVDGGSPILVDLTPQGMEGVASLVLSNLDVVGATRSVTRNVSC